MKCPKCGTEMKLVAEKLNPRRASCCAWDKPSMGSITYRDVYYCPECDESAIVRVNVRMKAKYGESREWKV